MSQAGFLISRRSVIAGMAAGSAAAMVAGSAFAQQWPTRPVTMLVPFGPGASNDIFTRQLSEVLSRSLGQPFVVENRPGAGGFTGALSVSQSPADGYRFLEMPSSVVAFKKVMGVNLDPLVDLTPVAQLATSPGGMVVPASLPVSSVKEFIDFANGRSQDTFYGYVGVGATQHQMAEKFRKITGVKLKGVNYQSAAEATTDLIAGRLHVQFSTIAGVRGQLDAGQLKLLAYTNDNFTPDSPKAPTMAEAGIDGMQGSQVWWGVFGPKGLSKELTDQMNAAINKALDDAAFIAVLAKSGAIPAQKSADGFIDTIKQEAHLVDEFVAFTGTTPK
ncbi:MAG: tripartite tricarboxylate transporter substrate binding protein [Rhizobiaceae bacterium]